MITDEIRLNLKKSVDNSYSIYLGKSHFKATLIEELRKKSPSRVTVIMDTNLAGAYRSFVNDVLQDSGFNYQIITFPAGEEHKNIDTVMKLFGELSDFNMDRKSLVIAIGGGVCGDMAGFLSSIYLRGIPFIQVPTSILSMVDSSVGGKTGVDTAYGKNLAGAFHQPLSVLIDIDFLQTLPKVEFINGMAEVIKHGLITDAGYFRWLLENRENILSLDRDSLIYMIKISCQIKAAVVEKDEKEAGLRQTLNLGHTFGHAIEHASHFKIPHGYSIALGTIAAAYISKQKAGLSEDSFNEIIRIYKDFGLLDFIQDFKTLIPQKIREAASTDKKNIAGQVKIVLLKEIGTVQNKDDIFSYSVEDHDFYEALNTVSALS